MASPDNKTDHRFEPRTVTPGFNDEIVYLERVSVTDRDEAAKLIREYSGFGSDEEVDPKPIHMRWVADGNDPELDEYPVDDVPCWLECEADHPDAVPFWKDAP
jgi:hypothetical protein